MEADPSWSNPAFETDEFDIGKSIGENYQIPRAGLNRTPSTKLTDAERDDGHVNGAIDPSYKGPYEDLQLKAAPPRGRKGNYAVSVPQQEQEEDFSLFSFFKDNPRFQSLLQFSSSMSKSVGGFYSKLKLLICALVVVAHFIAVLILPSKIKNEDEVYWCDGEGFLIIIYICISVSIFYFQIFKPFVGKKLQVRKLRTFQENPWMKNLRNALDLWFVKVLLYVCAIVGAIVFLIVDSAQDRSRLVSLVGIAFLTLFGFLFSTAPRKIIWRQVLWGLGLQFVMGLIILRWSVGKATFDCLGRKVHTFLKFTDIGSVFVYGRIVSELEVFAFKVLSVILFFSFCIQILYYYGAMQWIVIKLGWLLQISVGTTACESVNAAANIFLGQSESPLVIKPFLSQMTKSELHAVMTGGFATIAGSVLAAYISFGVDPAHLLTASVMSAPAALGFAKLFYPEVEVSRTNVKDIEIKKGTEANVLHAACEGVASAIPLVAMVTANLLAFIAFIAFIDAIMNWACVIVNIEEGVCSLSNLFGYLFMPLAFIMGVPWEDCYIVGQLIGTKTVINEFVGYKNLVGFVKNGQLSKRSEIIATYALCGFSNISGIGIQLGALGSMAPDRRGDLAKIALRAMISGSVACFLTACVAGTLISIEDVVSADNSTAL